MNNVGHNFCRHSWQYIFKLFENIKYMKFIIESENKKTDTKHFSEYLLLRLRYK